MTNKAVTTETQSGQMVARNTFFLSLSQFAVTAAAAVTGILLVRHFGLATYSYYAGAVSYALVFTILPTFSFNQAYLRQVVLEPERNSAYLGMTILLTLGSMILLWALAVAVAALRYDGLMVDLVAIVAGTLMLQAMINVLQKVFQARQRMELIAITTSVYMFVYCVLILLAIKFNASLIKVALLALASMIVGVIVTAVMAFRITRPSLDWKTAGPLLRHGLSFGGMGVLESLAYRVGPFILANLPDLTQVGLYNAAVRIADMPLVLSNVMMGALLPALYEASTDRARIIRMARKTLSLFLVLSIPLGIILMGQATPIVMLLYHRKGFAPAGPVLMVFALSLIFRFTSVLSNSLLYTLKRERYLIAVLGVLTGLNVLGSLPIGMKYGAFGVALVAVAIQGLWVSASFRKANKLLRADLHRLLLVPAIGGGLMLVVMYLLHAWPPLEIATALTVYVLWLALTRYFLPRDFVKLVKSVIGDRLSRMLPASASSMAEDGASSTLIAGPEVQTDFASRRVGFHVRGDERGGVAFVTAQLASEMAKLGREVHFFVDGPGSYAERLRQIGQIHLLGIPQPHPWSWRMGHLRVPDPQGVVKELRRLRVAQRIVAEVLEAHPVDVIIGNGHMSARTIGRACRRTGVPLVTLIHGRPNLTSTTLDLSLMLTRHYLRHCRKVVGVSHAVLTGIAGHYGIDSTVIYNRPMPHPKTSPAIRQAIRERYGIPADRFVAGSLGRMDPNKAYDRLVEAAYILRQEGRDLHVVIAGEPSSPDECEYYQKLHKQAEDCPLLRHRVTFPGFMNASEFFAIADVFVHIYLGTEGLSLATMEALDAGVPAIVSDRGGPVEIVNSSECGVVTRTEDPPLLAQAIRRLMDDTDYVQRLRQNGPKRIQEAFCFSTWGPQWLDLLDGIVRNP